MTETEVNIPLLRKAVEWAEAEAARPIKSCQWYQGEYVIPASALGRQTDCGTCYCIAGYIAQSLDERYVHTDTVDDVHAAEFAEDALGIGRGHSLFGGGNSIADVRRIAEDIAGERL